MELTSFLSFLILKILGWNPNVRIHFEIPSKAVVVYPHTTYWDAILILLYKWRYSSEMSSVYFLAMPQAFRFPFGWFLKRNGMIPGIKLEDSGKGLVDTITSRFKNEDSFFFVISPEGTLRLSPWRSGYYHIASNLKVPIMTAGLDYHKKELILIKLHSLKDKEELEIELHSDLCQITPKYPSQSWSHCLNSSS